MSAMSDQESWSSPSTDADDVWLCLLADRQGVPLPDSAAALVLGTQPRQLSQEGRLAAITLADRAIAALTAAQAELIAEVARVERITVGGGGPALVEDPERELVAAALVISPLSAARRVHEAITLCDRLPAVLAALRSGHITVPAARAVAEETAGLTDAQAREVAAEVVPRAVNETPGQVRRRARRLAVRADTRAAAERHEVARAARRVVVLPEPDGMASLWWTADAATIAAARTVIDDAARAAGTPEGIDAARSDALADLLLHRGPVGAPGALGVGGPRRRPVAAVHVGLGTLLGADDTPADVPGLGAIPAEAARAIAADADWQAFLHSADGQLVAVAPRAYTPSPAMARLVVARDRTCRFPGCAAPAHRCDLDHRKPFNRHDPDAGPTHPDNLQALCRRHHNLKTRGIWRVEQDPDGTLYWTGPRGQRLRTEHDPDPPW